MVRRELPIREALKATAVFAALGDPIRLATIARLCGDGPLPTVALQQHARVSRQAITKHLRILEAAGLLKSQRIGRDRLWRMHTQHLAAARDYLEQIGVQWDRRLERLQALVEGEGD